MPRKWDRLIINANLATMTGDGYGEILDAAIGVAGGQIAWLGPMKDLPDAPTECAVDVESAGGYWLTPGLIDCHTHLIFGGDRSNEFEARLNGVSYEEIARAGGGIKSSVTSTRAATEDELIESAAIRLRHLVSEGVTTLEIKSGYGLDTDTELKMLKVASRLDDRATTTIVPTFLGLHAIPLEFKDDSDRFVDQVIAEMLPAVAEQKLAVAVDAYLERIAFSGPQVERYLSAATDLGLATKLHADQLSDCDGARIAAEAGCLSAEHLEYANEQGIAAMAAAGTIAVILPGAFYALSETRKPPIDLFREHGVSMAVATDCNPGTSPMSSIILAMNMACVLFRMTPCEALRGTTIHAARALGMDDRIGTLEVGKVADLALWEIPHPSALSYWAGGRRCRRLFQGGQVVF